MVPNVVIGLKVRKSKRYDATWAGLKFMYKICTCQLNLVGIVFKTLHYVSKLSLDMDILLGTRDEEKNNNLRLFQ